MEYRPAMDKRDRCRIEKFSLYIKGPALNAQIVDPDGRRIADRVEDTVEKLSPALRGADGCRCRHG